MAGDSVSLSSDPSIMGDRLLKWHLSKESKRSLASFMEAMTSWAWLKFSRFLCMYLRLRILSSQPVLMMTFLRPSSVITFSTVFSNTVTVGLQLRFPREFPEKKSISNYITKISTLPFTVYIFSFLLLSSSYLSLRHVM